MKLENAIGFELAGSLRSESLSSIVFSGVLWRDPYSIKPVRPQYPHCWEHVLFDFGLLVALIVAGWCPTDLFAAERAFLLARVVLRGTSLPEADQPEQPEEFETAESLLLETIITVFVNPVVVQLSWFENSASRFRSVHVEATPGYRSRRPGLHDVSTIALTGWAGTPSVVAGLSCSDRGHHVPALTVTPFGSRTPYAVNSTRIF